MAVTAVREPPGWPVAGRYRLDGRIAGGGMGKVWRATDLVLGRPVAVKLLRPGSAGHEENLARFRTEARHAGSLTHPGIARTGRRARSAGRVPALHPCRHLARRPQAGPAGALLAACPSSRRAGRRGGRAGQHRCSIRRGAARPGTGFRAPQHRRACDPPCFRPPVSHRHARAGFPPTGAVGYARPGRKSRPDPARNRPGRASPPR
jgi:hypothetical protein